MLIQHWTALKDSAIYITVIDALRRDLLERAAKEPQPALNTAYNTEWTNMGIFVKGSGLFGLLAQFCCEEDQEVKICIDKEYGERGVGGY